MSHVYVTSDWHFGHNGITRFRTGFPTAEAHDQYILSRCLEVVTKRDVLFCLGDMAFTMAGVRLIEQIPCRKILVRGNHDTLTTGDYLHAFDEVEGAFRYKSYWFTHIPIHPMELFRGKNVHGHCHRGGPNQLQDSAGWENYYNAILEFNDYRPVNIQVVGERLQAQYKRAREVEQLNEFMERREL